VGDGISMKRKKGEEHIYKEWRVKSKKKEGRAQKLI
jgi:hypothetical protein